MIRNATKLVKSPVVYLLNQVLPCIVFTAERFHWSGLSRGEFTQLLKRRGMRPVGIPALDKAPPKNQEFDLQKHPQGWLTEPWAYSMLCDLNLFPDEVDWHNPHHLQAATKWSGMADQAACQIKRIMDRCRPRVCLTFQGYFLQDALLRWEAIGRGLRQVNFEITARNDRIIWDDVSGITTTRNLARNYFWKNENMVTDGLAHSYYQNWLRIFREKKGKDHAAPTRNFVKSGDRPLVVFLGQVYTDSSLLFSLEGFNNPVDVIKAVYDQGKNQACDIFIKLHPKEAAGADPVALRPYDKVTLRKLRQKYPEVCEAGNTHVWIDSENEWDTFSVVEQADLVITVNSQAGLEAAVLGRPVLVHRNCFYGGIGFTREYSDREELHFQMQRAANSTRSGFDVERARKFLYCFYERFCLPKDEKLIVKKVIGKF